MTAGYITFPEIDPVIFSLGPVSLRWYGLMYLNAFGLAWWLANRAANKAGSQWTEQQVSDLLFLGFLGVILGGRVGYVLFYQFDFFVYQFLVVQKTVGDVILLVIGKVLKKLGAFMTLRIGWVVYTVLKTVVVVAGSIGA